MKKTIFKGVGTALITPFKNDFEVDYDAFGKVVDFQLSEGIDALVVCGTTGESSTMTDKEKLEAIEFVVNRVNGRVPVIAGTGSNDTRHSIELTKEACKIGADAILVVTPYYNKTSQNGLVKSYFAIADSSTKPLILYNVPSRTGLNIEPQTYLKLSEHENIAAIKEANGNISKIVETAALVHGKLDIYSGNDDQIVPMMAIGAIGVISVLSNVVPRKTVEICKRFFEGDIQGSAKLQLELLPLINALFSDVNPIPVKEAMTRMGYGTNYLRLPLTNMDTQKREVLFNLLSKEGLI